MWLYTTSKHSLKVDEILAEHANYLYFISKVRAYIAQWKKLD